MDDISLYMMLDRRLTEHREQLRVLSERQKASLSILKQLQADAKEKPTSSAPPLSFYGLLKVLASNTGQAAGGIIAMAYVVRGGDIGKLLEIFIKASQ